MAKANTLCVSFTLIALFSSAPFAHSQSVAPGQLHTAEKPKADQAGRGGVQAANSAVRVGCDKSGGTGFVHKSGWIITAAHVVEPCGNTVRVQTVSGQILSVSTIKKEDLLDLAILSTEPKLDTGHALSLSANTLFAIGSRVEAWGFPSGYDGLVPLLSVGYLAGVAPTKNKFGVSPPRWVVNGAFNLGNSGGPVISIDDGSVIGVVSSKLAPIPTGLEDTLKALSSSRSILMYKRSNPDGTVEDVSEGQIVAEVLYYLRSQIQLVVGYAVSVKELRKFLESNGIEP